MGIIIFAPAIEIRDLHRTMKPSLSNHDLNPPLDPELDFEKPTTGEDDSFEVFVQCRSSCCWVTGEEPVSSDNFLSLHDFYTFVTIGFVLCKAFNVK